MGLRAGLESDRRNENKNKRKKIENKEDNKKRAGKICLRREKKKKEKIWIVTDWKIKANKG